MPMRWNTVCRLTARLLVVLVAASCPMLAAGKSEGTSMSCEDMAKQRKQMMESMKAMDARLSDLVAAMDRAKGDERIDAIAAVVHELVEQRSKMRDRMMDMQPKMMAHMMAHMMGHMHSGSAEGGRDCPAMEPTTMDDGETQDHGEHHRH